MKVLRQILTQLRVLRSARRNRADLVKALVLRPQLLVGTAVFETALSCAAGVDPRLKLLAQLKVAASSRASGRRSAPSWPWPSPGRTSAPG